MIFVNFSYRFAWFLFGYMSIYIFMFLHEPGKAFNMSEFGHPVDPSSNEDFPTRYERFYLVDRPQRW